MSSDDCEQLLDDEGSNKQATTVPDLDMEVQQRPGADIELQVLQPSSSRSRHQSLPQPLLQVPYINETDSQLRSAASLLNLQYRECSKCGHAMPPPFLHYQAFQCERCAHKSELHCIRCDSVISEIDQSIIDNNNEQSIDEDKIQTSMTGGDIVDVANTNMCHKCRTHVGSWSELCYFLFTYDWEQVSSCPQCPAPVSGLKYRCINCHTLMICPPDDIPDECVACAIPLRGIRQYYVFLRDRRWLSAHAWTAPLNKMMCFWN